MTHEETDRPPADVLKFLRDIQERRTHEPLMELFRAARMAYLFGIDRSKHQTPFALHIRVDRKIKNVWKISDAYDRIAAHYRDAYHSGGQRMLPFDDTPYEELLRQGWRDFYAEEVERLAQDDAIVIAILSIAVYEDEPPADAAQEFLETLLDWRYDPVRLRDEAEAE